MRVRDVLPSAVGRGLCSALKKQGAFSAGSTPELCIPRGDSAPDVSTAAALPVAFVLGPSLPGKESHESHPVGQAPDLKGSG